MTEYKLQQLLKELLAERIAAKETGGEAEAEFIEFKKNDYSKEEIGKYFSALSNGACLKNKDFGFLIYGIDDQTLKILGTKKNFKIGESRETLELHLRNYVSPTIEFEIYQFDCPDHEQKNQSILLFKLSAAKGKPTTYNKTPWARVGSHNVNLNLDQYSDLLRRICNSKTDWSAQILEGATFEDLDPEAIKKACEKIKKITPSLSEFEDPKILLDKAKITLDGKITKAALVLLGRAESTRFLSPAPAEILHKLVGWNLPVNEVTGKHFTLPFFLTVSDFWKNIRNNKVKIFTNGLFPDIADKYDEEAVLEAINNCIAHQDYHERSRIIVYEKPDRITFENAGSFFEGKVEDYIEGTKTPKNYRNYFLANAMRTLGMIDIHGSGVNKIYRAQKRKFFPMPDYKTTDKEVSITIYGKTLNDSFARILKENTDLNLTSAILLDHVQKNIPITGDAAMTLREKGLIEGRKPNYFISAKIASVINQEDEYLRNKGADNRQLKDWILHHLDKFKKTTRPQIDKILIKFTSETLSEEQRKRKITNLIHEMSKKDKTIKNIGTNRKPIWVKN